MDKQPTAVGREKDSKSKNPDQSSSSSRKKSMDRQPTAAEGLEKAAKRKNPDLSSPASMDKQPTVTEGRQKAAKRKNPDQASSSLMDKEPTAEDREKAVKRKKPDQSSPASSSRKNSMDKQPTAAESREKAVKKKNPDQASFSSMDKQLAPANREKAAKRKNQKSCCCNWGAECGAFRAAIFQLPEGSSYDLWKVNNKKLKTGKNKIGEKFSEIIKRELGPRDDLCEFSIAVHHWSIPLLQFRHDTSLRNWVAPITAEQAKEFGISDPHPKGNGSDLFCQSPTTSKSDLQDLVSLWSTARGMRQLKREIESLSTVTKNKTNLPIVSKNPGQEKDPVADGHGGDVANSRKQIGAPAAETPAAKAAISHEDGATAAPAPAIHPAPMKKGLGVTPATKAAVSQEDGATATPAPAVHPAPVEKGLGVTPAAKAAVSQEDGATAAPAPVEKGLGVAPAAKAAVSQEDGATAAPAPAVHPAPMEKALQSAPGASQEDGPTAAAAPHPIKVCRGLQHRKIGAVLCSPARQFFVIRGKALRQWNYNGSANSWHSRKCSGSVDPDAKGDMCGNCRKDNLMIRKERDPWLFEADARQVDPIEALLPSQTSIIEGVHTLRVYIGNDPAFLQSASLQKAWALLPQTTTHIPGFGKKVLTRCLAGFSPSCFRPFFFTLSTSCETQNVCEDCKSVKRAYEIAENKKAAKKSYQSR
jgi:hypothetical protein